MFFNKMNINNSMMISVIIIFAIMCIIWFVHYKYKLKYSFVDNTKIVKRKQIIPF